MSSPPTDDPNDVQYLIALTEIPNIGAVTARHLISHCGSAKAVFEASGKTLLQTPNVGSATAAQILQTRAQALQRAAKELEFVEKQQVQVYSYLSPAYPQRLKHYHDAPLVLFYKGNADLNPKRTVSIIGTRKPTDYGKTICHELIEQLATYKPLVLSGLAYGIDVAAHRKALLEGLPTVGVMGTGINRIYPDAHTSIAYQMTENGGILTEYTADTPPHRERFPMRNRIIAGMSDAVIVVETGTNGGSMITAQIANSYNKDVFAVPGKVKDPTAKGCHLLIKRNQAALIESGEDIAYAMRWDAEDTPQGRQQPLFVELSDEERAVINFLKANGNQSIDALAFLLSFSASKMSALLFEMELKGVVKQLPGKYFSVT